ncbi:MAG: S4 domain-containing protein [Pseudomonadota bacterium]
MASKGGRGSTGSDAPDALRLDRWLWCVRLYKTRPVAAAAIVGGHVHLNGERVKPAREVAAGDRLRLAIGGRDLELDVVAIPARRGPAPEARACYLETPESQVRQVRMTEVRRIDALSRPRSEGRPDKKERRELRSLARRQGGD